MIAFVVMVEGPDLPGIRFPAFVSEDSHLIYFRREEDAKRRADEFAPSAKATVEPAETGRPDL